MATTDGGTGKEEAGKPSVRNLRSMWQQRADQSTKEKVDQPMQPPPSPSSKASAAINAQNQSIFDPFTPYGISFTSDQNKALVLRKVAYGGPADRAGVPLFPGDVLQSIDGIDVHGWPMERVAPLLTQNRSETKLRLGVRRNGMAEVINVEIDSDAEGRGRAPSPLNIPGQARANRSLPPSPPGSSGGAIPAPLTAATTAATTSLHSSSLPTSLQGGSQQQVVQHPPLVATSAPAPAQPLELQQLSSKPPQLQQNGAPHQWEARDPHQHQHQHQPGPSPRGDLHGGLGSEAESAVSDDMRANVVRKYKTRIQELSQTLEREQVDSFQLRREAEDLRRRCMEKDELLREQNDAMGRLTSRLEEENANSEKAERELYEAHQQIRALQYDASGGSSGSVGGDALTHLRIADALREDVSRLTKQLMDVKGERDSMVARLERGGGGGGSGGRAEDGGELVRELKLQLIEKDARIQAMESQCASLKRSSVIQAVELQELHDHLNGLEKQKSLQEVQRFPPLPPLTSVHESPYEQVDDEDGKMKAIMLADEALQSAQHEITILKKSEERRVQLELMLAAAEKEMAMLREQGPLATGVTCVTAAGGMSVPRFHGGHSLEELMSQLAEFEEKYSLAEASYRGAQTEVRELQRSMGEARAREAKVREELIEMRQRCERAEQANAATVEQQRGTHAPASPSPSPSTSPGAAASRDASGQPPPSPKSLSEYGASDARADAVIGRLKVVQDELAQAVQVAASAYDAVRERGVGGGAMDAVSDVRRLLDKMSVVVAGAVRGTPNGGDDAVSRHMAELRAEMKSKNEEVERMDGDAKKLEGELRRMEGEMTRMSEALEARGDVEQEGRGLGRVGVDKEAMGRVAEQLEEAKKAERRACEERDAARRELSRVRSLGPAPAVTSSSSSSSSPVPLSPARVGGSDVASEGSSPIAGEGSPGLKKVLELQVRLLEADKDRGALQCRVMDLEKERAGMERQLKLMEEGSIARQIRDQELERENEELRRRIEAGEGGQGGGEAERGEDEYTTRLFEALHEEKKQIEEQLQVAVDKKRFLERCIEDARGDIARLEKQEEEAQRLLHEEQLMTAKMDGKLQAAQTRVMAMEREIAAFREESDGMQDEITQLRKQLMQTGSDEDIEKSALQHKLKLKEDENNGIRRERDVIQDRLQGEISTLEREIHDLKERLAGREALLQQKDHKLGVFAEQLKVQKDKVAQAEQAHRMAEEALSQMAHEAGAVLHRGGGGGSSGTAGGGGVGDGVGFSQHGGDFSSPPAMHGGGRYTGGDVGYGSKDADGMAQMDMERAMMRHEEDLTSAQHTVQDMTAELMGVQREKEEAIKTIRAQAIELQQKRGQVETLTAIINRMQGVGGGSGGGGGREDVMMDPHIPGGGPGMMDERGWRQTLM